MLESKDLWVTRLCSCSTTSSFLFQSFWPVFHSSAFLLNSQQNHYSLPEFHSFVLLNLHVCPREPRLIMIMRFFFFCLTLLEAGEQTGASSRHSLGEDRESIQQCNTLSLHGYIYKWSYVLFCTKLYRAGNSDKHCNETLENLGRETKRKGSHLVCICSSRLKIPQFPLPLCWLP